MTEASYTAWDDKQYVWPPPDGWYQAPDNKWWPEGYGPQPAEPAAADDSAAVMEADGSADAEDLVGQFGRADFGSDGDSVGDIAQSAMAGDGAGIGTAVEGAVDSAVDSATDAPGALGGFTSAASGVAASGIDSATAGIGDAASDLTGGLDGVADDLGDDLGEAASGVADAAPDLGDLTDGVGDRLGISEVDGMPTSEIGEAGVIDGLTERVSDFGDVPAPDLGDLPAPGLDDLPAPGLDDSAPNFDDLDLPPLGDNVADSAGDVTKVLDMPAPDDIPSIQDLASPDMDISNLPGSQGPDEDMTQVVPTDIGGQFSDPLPPPPGSGPTVDAPQPGLDAPKFDGDGLTPPSFDAPDGGAPDFDLPTFDPSGVEPPTFEAPAPGGPPVEPPSFGVPAAGQGLGDLAPPAPNPAMGDVPPPAQLAQAGQPQPGIQAPQQQFGGSGYGQAAAPAIGLQQDILSSNKGGGRGKTLLFVLLGVLALAAIGAALYWQFGRDDGEGAADTVTTGPGSINEPHPRTTGVVVFYPDGDTDQRWVIEVLDPVSVGTGDLAAGSDDGDVYAVTRVRVRNESGSDGASIGDLRFNAVNGNGDLISREDNQCPATAEDLDYDAAVAVGADVTGAVCWELPASDLNGLKLGLESGKVAGRVHISLQ